MSKKQATARAEYLKMNIELADNGIIIRNPNEEDEVTLALNLRDSCDYNGDNCREDEYKAIGKKVFDFLMDDIVENHTEFIITNFDIEVQVVAKGREFQT